MRQLVLLRHGQSEYNRQKRFTGWADAGLTAQGVEEARRAGRLLKNEGHAFDVAFTSLLRRAIHTAKIVLEELGLPDVPIQADWRLNERHIGTLEGHDRSAMVAEFGEETVKSWIRSYRTRPPAMASDDPRHPRHNPRYRHVPAEDLPAGESLNDVMARFLPCWEGVIAPAVRSGRRVLVVSHGAILRAFRGRLDNEPGADAVALSIPNGQPLVYEFDGALRPVRSYYLDAAGRGTRM